MSKKHDLSVFECGVVIDTILASLSISRTIDLLGFSHTKIPRIYGG